MWDYEVLYRLKDCLSMLVQLSGAVIANSDFVSDETYNEITHRLLDIYNEYFKDMQ